MKKRILFHSDNLGMGGIEKVLVETLKILDDNNYDVSLLIKYDLKSQNILKKQVPKKIPITFLNSFDSLERVKSYKNKNFLYKIYYKFLYARLQKNTVEQTLKYIEEQGPFDIFIDYNGGVKKYIQKIPIPEKIIFSHLSYADIIRKKSKLNRIQKRLSHYNTIVAICDDMQEELKKLFPQVSNRIIRIYNPFSFEKIFSLREDSSTLSQYEKELLRKDYCLMVSRLDNQQKDFLTLFHAFQIVKESGVSDRLYLVGDGPDKEFLKQEAKKLQLENDIIFLGLQENPYVWMQHAKFLVHSSHLEGFGLVLVEALACDKMVITSDCPVGPREILNGESCGVLFPVGDVKKLAELLIQYLTDTSLRASYEKKAKESIERFDEFHFLQDFQKIL